MLQNNCRQTPWANFNEWDSVRKSLFPFSRDSSSVERIRKGLDRIAVWECRGRVPLAIQITSQILRLKLSDCQVVAEGNFNRLDNVDSETIRLAYAMAVVRLVNGVVEPEQRAIGIAASVSDIAARCGLPRWFVDIRHDATHTSLPSLSNLRIAADTALAWLQSRYWQSQADHIASVPLRIRELLGEVQTLSKKISDSLRHSKHKKKSSKKRKRAKGDVDATSPSEPQGPSSLHTETSVGQPAKSMEVTSSTSELQEDLDAVITCITRTMGPSTVRDVIVPALVNQKTGLLVIRTTHTFSDAKMRLLQSQWKDFLEAMQRAWPFFYGCLLTGLAKSILLHRVGDGSLLTSSDHISSETSSILIESTRRPEELSLLWWLEILLSLLLSGVEGLVTNTGTSKKRQSLMSQMRISLDDISRLGSCASHIHARDIYGKKIFNRLLEVCDRGSDLDRGAGGSKGAGILMQGEWAGSNDHAVELNNMDAEMRALVDGSITRPTHLGLDSLEANARTPHISALAGSKDTNEGAKLLSLEELEQSLQSRESYVEGTAEPHNTMSIEECAEGHSIPNVSRASEQGDQGQETQFMQTSGDDSWSLCSSWQACPIGHLVGQMVEVGAGMSS